MASCRLIFEIHGRDQRLVDHLYHVTLLNPDELPQARELVQALEKAGVDALIVQDPAVLSMSDTLIMHASTQCALRTPEKAKGLESLPERPSRA